MNIQVNSGNSLTVDQRLIETAEEIAQRTLGRFENQLTRLEVHINDLNSHKSGPQDIRCQIEARPTGLDPVSASHDAENVNAALRGAVQKMERLLDSLLGRRANKRSHLSRRSPPPPPQTSPSPDPESDKPPANSPQTE